LLVILTEKCENFYDIHIKILSYLLLKLVTFKTIKLVGENFKQAKPQNLILTPQDVSISSISAPLCSHFNSQSLALTYTLQPNRLSFTPMTLIPFLSFNGVTYVTVSFCHSRDISIEEQITNIEQSEKEKKRYGQYHSQPLPAMFSEMSSSKNNTHVILSLSLSLSPLLCLTIALPL
jgi:hypothetical protein